MPKKLYSVDNKKKLFLQVLTPHMHFLYLRNLFQLVLQTGYRLEIKEEMTS